MADALREDEQPLAPDERVEMLAFAERVQMGDRVPGALRFCPEN